MIVFLCSALAEILAWLLFSFTTSTPEYGWIFNLCAGFHASAEGVRYFMFSGVENHPSVLDAGAMAVVFFGVALVLWVCIFMGVFAVGRAIGRLWRGLAMAPTV
jgi:hypothetical protein